MNNVSDTTILSEDVNILRNDNDLIKSAKSPEIESDEESLKIYKETISELISDNKYLLKKIEYQDEVLSLKDDEKDQKIIELLEELDELKILVKSQKSKIADLEEEIEVYQEQIVENNSYISKLLESVEE